VLCIGINTQASAQIKSAALTLDSVFFADNVEFFAPYRTGATILGSWQRVQAEFQLSDLARLKLGLYALERNGSERRTELARPVVTLTMGTQKHRFIIGTIETGNRPWGTGPDRTTPHGLLPPLAVETLWFSRAYEAGLQWRSDTEQFAQDVWFDYQAAITPEHRELFDGGIVGRVQKSATAPIALLYQFHVVHHGGQQHDAGRVSDSFGFGPGVMVRKHLPTVGLSTLEVYGLFSHDRPDRQVDALTVKGKALFARAAAERGGFRAHALAWRGHKFKHEAGDANYLSQLPDGSNIATRRDYFEMGLAKVFHPAPTLDFEASGRAHLVQNRWGYSYRVMANVHVGIWKTKGE
jgi:hypothetical protein